MKNLNPRFVAAAIGIALSSYALGGPKVCLVVTGVFCVWASI